MIPVTRLTIRPALATPRELALIEQGRREWAAEQAEEQHWAGPAGLGGDVRPAPTITFEEAASRVAQGIFDGGGGPEDLDRAASLIAAKAPDDRVAVLFSRALRSAAQESREAVTTLETWTAEQAERESMDMDATTESMTRRLIAGQSEEYLKEQARTAISNADSKQQHPRASGPLGYPVNVRPVAEEVDREVRGALDAPMSAKLRSLAQEVSQLARLSSNPRQRSRLTARAVELQRMSARQFERELESDIATADDPTEASNVMSKLASDMRDEAGANGAQPDDFSSFDDWGDRPTADQQLADDVRDQILDEDLPRVPAPGRRYAGEDQLGDPAAGTDEPAGAMKNAADDDILQRVRRGRRSGFGSHSTGRPGRRYSGMESMREAADLTSLILEDQAINWLGSHGSW